MARGATVPRNRRETSELRAATYESAADMVQHWTSQGQTVEQCIAALRHHAFGLRLTGARCG